MTLEESDQDTSLNVRDGVQIPQRRMRCKRQYLMHSQHQHQDGDGDLSGQGVKNLSPRILICRELAQSTRSFCGHIICKESLSLADRARSLSSRHDPTLSSNINVKSNLSKSSLQTRDKNPHGRRVEFSANHLTFSLYNTILPRSSAYRYSTDIGVV